MNAIKSYILILFLSTFSYAFAQDTASNKHRIEEIVVTGQFKPTSLKNSVYKVKTINRDEIIRRGTVDMPTLLQTQLGIRFSNDLVLGETDIQMMGMTGQNVKILLDGVPIIDRGSTKQSLSQIDVNNIERIEIVEGPVSVLYGSDGLAGAINIISLDLQKNKSSLNIGLRILEESVNKEYSPADKEGRHNVHANIAYKKDWWSLNWTGSRNNFGGYQGNQTGRSLLWQPKEQWLSSAKLGYQKNDIQAHYQVQYVHEDIFTPGDILANYRYTDKNYLTNRINQVIQGNWKIQDKLNLAASINQQNYKRETVTKIYDLEKKSMELGTQAGEQDISKFAQTFARTTLNYQWNQKLDLLLGLEMDYDRGSGARIANNAEIYDLAAYLSVDYQPITWLMLRPGVRFQHNSIYDSPPLIPSLNSKIMLSPELDLRLSYARGFRAPSLRDLYFSFFDSNHQIEGNKDLKAEHNNAFMANLNYQKEISDNLYFKTSLNGFYNRFNNLIVLGMKPGNAQINTYLNLANYKTTGAGLENQLKYKHTKVDLGVVLVGRMNTQKEQFSDLQEFLWSPEVNASISQNISKWKTNVSVFYKFNGKRPGFEAIEQNGTVTSRQTSISSYQQLDLSINKDLYFGLSVQAGVRNLTNTINIENNASTSAGAHTTTNSSIPIAYGRSYFFGILYNLNK